MSGDSRAYDTKPNGTQSVPAELDASKIVIVHTTTPKTKPPKEKLVFGRTMTDHMVEVDWTEKEGWGVPMIKPFENLSVSPAALVFHCALECFEGMKAYRDSQGKIRLFRPEINAKRFQRSCQRMTLPMFDDQAFLDILKTFVKVESDWIPEGIGYSLYLRPTMIATEPVIGVGPTSMAKLVIMASPVGPYYRGGFVPVSLLADPNHVRAWPGGVGSYKCGGNYAPGPLLQRDASKRGYDQLLWIRGDDHQVTEAGTMNFFMFWKNEDGERELLTAPLDGTILPGVTRRSILDLCTQWGEFKVSEKVFTMKDIVKALDENRVIEMFGAGTACIVSPIKKIGYLGKDYSIPLALGKSGELTNRINNSIQAIQYGETPSEFSVVVE